MEAFGIENIKKIFGAGLALSAATMENFPAWRDGKTDGADFAFIPKLIPVLGDMTSMQWNQIIPEAKDIHAAEMAELYEFFKLHLVLENKTMEAVVEEGLGLVIDIAKSIQGIIALVKVLGQLKAV